MEKSQNEILFEYGLEIAGCANYLHQPGKVYRLLAELWTKAFLAGQEAAQKEADDTLAQAVGTALHLQQQTGVFVDQSTDAPMGGWGVIGGRADNGDRTAPPEGAVVADAE